MAERGPLSPWNSQRHALASEYKTPSRRQQPSMKSLLQYDAEPSSAAANRGDRNVQTTDQSDADRTIQHAQDEVYMRLQLEDSAEASAR